MIIGVDGNDANVQEQVGVSVYTRNLLQEFQKNSSAEQQFRIFLRHPPVEGMPAETEYFHYTVVRAKLLWSQFFLPLHLYTKTKLDVFFSPAHYSPRYCPVPTVVTVHDLAYFYYPNEFLKKDLYKLKNWTEYSVKKAAQVIAVSKTTKRDILSFYHKDKDEVNVVYNGYGSKELPITSNSTVLETYSLKKENYILYVGTVQPRKNISILITAFEIFCKKNPTFKLVLAGKKGWLYDSIFEQAQNSPVKEKIIFTGYLPDNDINQLYANAFCYVLPSLYEGFGIPLLEAMSRNCPVISSFAASLPEVGGEACIYFDPQNANGLVDDLESLKDAPLRKELITKGQERTQLFSWKKCAEETLSVIKKAAVK